MKKFVNIFKAFVAIAIMALALASCCKFKNRNDEPSIIGDWKADYATQKTYENGVLKTEEIYYVNDDVMLVSINADLTAYIITYEKDDIDADVSLMNWTQENYILKLADAENPEYVTVVTFTFLSDDQIVWEFVADEEIEDTNGDGVIEKTIVSYTMSRVK